MEIRKDLARRRRSFPERKVGLCGILLEEAIRCSRNKDYRPLVYDTMLTGNFHRGSEKLAASIFTAAEK
jgi:hypothetical protein